MAFWRYNCMFVRLYGEGHISEAEGGGTVIRSC
jgi:hypothetical protein